MTVYYNEIDPRAAQWLRNLIAAGEIAPGVVDERSIREVVPGDLVGFTQCHFFAGIGVWSDALRRAGWPDDRPVWTGSCPCQPFSTAGVGAGFDDPRHIWPTWGALIRECRPRVCFGEQVESKDGRAWLDLVQADLEDWGYAVGPIVLPAAGFGAPHGRHRFFFVADADGSRSDAKPGDHGEVRGLQEAQRQPEHGSSVPGRRRPARLMGNANGSRHALGARQPRDDRAPGDQAAGEAAIQAGPVGGFWRDAEWIPCSDGKARAVEPGSFPLAYGAQGRVGRLRAYGNAIAAPVAEEFIRAYLDVTQTRNC